MLHQLANKGSSNKLIMDLPENDSIPYKSNNKIMTSDLPLFKGLVTTTLTTLHTRLTNECDRALSMILLVDNHSPPQEQLLSIISDLYKMTEMVNWESQHDQKKEIKNSISTIEQSVLNQQLTVITVKDTVCSLLLLLLLLITHTRILDLKHETNYEYLYMSILQGRRKSNDYTLERLQN